MSSYYRHYTTMTPGLVVCWLALLFLVLGAEFTAATHNPDIILPHRFRGGKLLQDLAEEKKKALLHRRNPSSGLYGAKALVPVSNITANYYTQLINHDDPSMGTFQQRYYIDYTAWWANNMTGPAMLYISGEAEAMGTPDGYSAEWAYSVGALVVCLEHRWYGGSPLGPLTNKTLLAQLTIKNALADLRAFQQYIQSTVLNDTSNSTQWVVVGGSYAGALSAWFKVTYPTAAVASWSSSGVVHPTFDYTDYEGHIVSVLNPTCKASLLAVFKQLYGLWDDPVKFAEAQALFGVQNMTKAGFAFMLADSYSGPVQYGRKEELCNTMVPLNTTDPLAQFAAYVKITFGSEYGQRQQQRLSGTSHTISTSGHGSGDTSEFLWNYQCCTQVAYWQIGYPHNRRSVSIRPEIVSTQYFMDICYRDYGDVFPNLYSFNKQYGGYHPPATHVIALQGSDDPFGPAGVNEQLGPDYPYSLAQCTGCGHCGDLRAQQPHESPSKQAQRTMIIQYLNKWLGRVYNVTFFISPNVIALDDVQKAVLAAMPSQSRLSANIYNCDGLGTSHSQCYGSFTTEEMKQEAIRLANAGNISGVTGAEVPPTTTSSMPPGTTNSSEDDDDNNGLSTSSIVGIAVGSTVGAVVLGMLVYVVVRRRLKQDDSYHSLN